MTDKRIRKAAKHLNVCLQNWHLLREVGIMSTTGASEKLLKKEVAFALEELLAARNAQICYEKMRQERIAEERADDV